MSIRTEEWKQITIKAKELVDNGATWPQVRSAVCVSKSYYYSLKNNGPARKEAEKHFASHERTERILAACDRVDRLKRRLEALKRRTG